MFHMKGKIKMNTFPLHSLGTLQKGVVNETIGDKTDKIGGKKKRQMTLKGPAHPHRCSELICLIRPSLQACSAIKRCDKLNSRVKDASVERGLTHAHAVQRGGPISQSK